MISAVVFDLDGVLRLFADDAPIEDAHQLPRGALAASVFDATVLDDAVCGRITFERWIECIGDLLAQRHGEPARGAAAANAVGMHAVHDQGAGRLVQELRTLGVSGV